MAHFRHILLAGDDKDDTTLFFDVLKELSLFTHFVTVSDGEKPMELLNETKEQLPDILFLDLTMPRKNGFDCLSEMRQTERLKQLPVIIFTTSYEPDVVNLLCKKGVQYYIRKPNNFEQLKKVIHLALTLTEQTGISKPPKEKFVLSSQRFKNEIK